MKKINVTRSSMPPFEEYCAEIKDLWDSRWLTNMGTKHEELRGKLQEYLGVKCLDLLTNGHMAIEVSLQALGLAGEVLFLKEIIGKDSRVFPRPVGGGIHPISYYCVQK